MFTAMGANFMPLLSPTNQMSYDTAQFRPGDRCRVRDGAGGIPPVTAAVAGTASTSPARASGAYTYPRHLRGTFRPSLLLRRRSGRTRSAEIDLFGVYVAPISLMIVATWLLTIALRRIVSRSGLTQHVRHPALFVFAVYIIVLSSWILIVARS
jgi:hypothetical protein